MLEGWIRERRTRAPLLLLLLYQSFRFGEAVCHRSKCTCTECLSLLSRYKPTEKKNRGLSNHNTTPSIHDLLCLELIDSHVSPWRFVETVRHYQNYLVHASVRVFVSNQHRPWRILPCNASRSWQISRKQWQSSLWSACHHSFIVFLCCGFVLTMFGAGYSSESIKIKFHNQHESIKLL